MTDKPIGQKALGGMMCGINAVSQVFSALKPKLTSRVPFVISLVVAYRLLEIGVDLDVENAVAFGSRPQKMRLARASTRVLHSNI
jgi:hypothetical protein